MHQFILRGIPKNVFSALRALAQKRGQSINQTLLTEIMQALGLKDSISVRRDLSDLAGTWSKKQINEFNQATRIFEKIDPEVWKS